MAKAILAIPEKDLQQVIDVIRAGLLVLKNNISPDVKEGLEQWCLGEQEYLERLEKGEPFGYEQES